MYVDQIQTVMRQTDVYHRSYFPWCCWWYSCYYHYYVEDNVSSPHIIFSYHYYSFLYSSSIVRDGIAPVRKSIRQGYPPHNEGRLHVSVFKKYHHHIHCTNILYKVGVECVCGCSHSEKIHEIERKRVFLLLLFLGMIIIFFLSCVLYFLFLISGKDLLCNFSKKNNSIAAGPTCSYYYTDFYCQQLWV